MSDSAPSVLVEVTRSFSYKLGWQWKNVRAVLTAKERED